MRRGLASQVIVVAIAGVAAALAGTPERIAFAAAGAAFPFTVAGAAFPDVDSRSSIPFRRFRLGAAILTGAIAAVLLSRGRPMLVTAAEALPVTRPAFVAGAWVGVAVTGAALATYLFVTEVLPPHRAHLHQLPTGIVATVTIFSLLSLGAVGAGVPSPIPAAALASAGFLVGFASHLVADRDPRTGRRLLFRRKTYVGDTLDRLLAATVDPYLAMLARLLGGPAARLRAGARWVLRGVLRAGSAVVRGYDRLRAMGERVADRLDRSPDEPRL